jgi:DNA-binding CsgD family transcriptional regulator
VKEPEGAGGSSRRSGTGSARPAKVGLGIAVDFVPESDPAYPIIAAILRVVPASRWAFARLEARGELGRLLGSGGNGGDRSRLESEFASQRAKSKTGSRIAATLGPLGEFESGVTLLFADARANFGILTLMRTGDLGPFTSSEISVLTLALDAVSEHLSALQLNVTDTFQPFETADGRDDVRNGPDQSGEASYVLDNDMQIVLAWTAEEQRRVALTGLRTRLSDRLPAVLEESVRALVAGWRSDPLTQKRGVARPVPFLVVRTEPMTGPAGLFIGVRLARSRSTNSLRGPAARFHITPRELQVLALLLDGARLEDITRKLHISSSTIQDHIKSMVEKTGSRNRTELIAQVLGWETGSNPARA